MVEAKADPVEDGPRHVEPIRDGKRDSMLEDVKLQQPSAETYAAIMAQHAPDVRGSGYIKLYMVAGAVFLCSTMSGMSESLE